jgi:hypothetical protein
VKKALLHLWQLPQNLLGALLSNILGDQTKYYNVKKYNDTLPYFVCHKIAVMGVSLGQYSIVGWDSDDDLTVRHERIGHAKQSTLLGPLYLLIIGLPSLLGNIYSRLFKKDSTWYYNQPWEKWADKLAGIKR